MLNLMDEMDNWNEYVILQLILLNGKYIEWNKHKTWTDEYQIVVLNLQKEGKDIFKYYCRW